MFSEVVLLLVLLVNLREAEGRKYFRSFAGPFWILPDKMYNCPPEETIEHWINITVKFNNMPKSHMEAQRLTIWEGVEYDFTDALTGYLKFDSWANNEWKENAIAPMRFPNMGCSVWRTFAPDFYRKLWGLDPTSKEACIIPARDYFMNNTAVDWTFPVVKQFVYGFYRLKLTFFNGKTSVFCSTIEVKILPKPLS